MEPGYLEHLGSIAIEGGKSYSVRIEALPLSCRRCLLLLSRSNHKRRKSASLRTWKVTRSSHAKSLLAAQISRSCSQEITLNSKSSPSIGNPSPSLSTKTLSSPASQQ